MAGQSSQSNVTHQRGRGAHIHLLPTPLHLSQKAGRVRPCENDPAAVEQSADSELISLFNDAFYFLPWTNQQLLYIF